MARAIYMCPWCPAATLAGALAGAFVRTGGWSGRRGDCRSGWWRGARELAGTGRAVARCLQDRSPRTYAGVRSPSAGPPPPMVGGVTAGVRPGARCSCSHSPGRLPGAGTHSRSGQRTPPYLARRPCRSPVRKTAGLRDLPDRGIHGRFASGGRDRWRDRGLFFQPSTSSGAEWESGGMEEWEWLCSTRSASAQTLAQLRSPRWAPRRRRVQVVRSLARVPACLPGAGWLHSRRPHAPGAAAHYGEGRRAPPTLAGHPVLTGYATSGLSPVPHQGTKETALLPPGGLAGCREALHLYGQACAPLRSVTMSLGIPPGMRTGGAPAVRSY
jgi:hypothetical protein